jgi:HEAT repeat protein
MYSPASDGRGPFSLTLQGGDRRSIGNSNRVAAVVLRWPDRLAELIECLWSGDPVIRMRAADATEKVSAKRPALLAPFKTELLTLADETAQAELRWHLAQMIPRLPLSQQERVRATAALRDFLGDRSSIVRTFALQALAELSRGNPELEADVIDLLERTIRTGTPAMKARSRKLLAQFRKDDRLPPSRPSC